MTKQQRPACDHAGRFSFSWGGDGGADHQRSCDAMGRSKQRAGLVQSLGTDIAAVWPFDRSGIGIDAARRNKAWLVQAREDTDGANNILQVDAALTAVGELHADGGTGQELKASDIRSHALW